MPDQHDGRRRRLLDLLPDDVDALLVTQLVNVAYLSGFTGSNAVLLLRRDRPALLGTDGRYREQAATEAPDLPLLLDRATATAVAARAAADGVRRLGVEAHAVTLTEHAALSAALGRAVVVPVDSRPVEVLRIRKDPDEVTLLRRACAVTSSALEALLPTVRAGQTEREVARRLEDLMRDHGADGPAFATICAAGEHSAVPHHQPTDRPLRAGDLLKCDFGARVAGYHADCTRTVALGPPADWQREVHALVEAAQAAGRAAAVPGAKLRDVDSSARDVVAEGGYADAFVHGLGHGVGLQIHEAPMLGPTATGTLDAAAVVTIEPGVYLPGRGGVRIEDTLVVTDAGPEVLTTPTRELLVL